MISYEGLEKALREKGIGKSELTKELGLPTRTVAKIARGERLARRSIEFRMTWLLCKRLTLDV